MLGLAWAPALGAEDGPAAGLARFWGVPTQITVLLALIVGALALQLVVIRLCSTLWSAPGGPLRRRRVAAAALHIAVPALAWVTVATAVGFSPPLRAYATVLAAVLAAFAGAFFWLPRHPLSLREAPALGTVVVVAVFAAAVALAALVVGSPRQGGAQALLWGRERTTSNVPASAVRVPLTPPRGRRAPRGG